MVRVMAQGVFDIIHMGHVHYLEKARELGDELVVVVASDKTVRARKHEPITPQEMRRDLVASLRCVDRAVIGSDGEDRYVTVREIKPDIIALGHDQEHDEQRIRLELQKRGIDCQVVRLDYYYHDLDGTRKIIQKILSMWAFSREMERIEGEPVMDEDEMDDGW
ncbi:MAG: adenylyltransferase/cytidyltransferase family protein, partial [Thermoplasmata archaeon]|nr:FAD synthase [Thermoplasmata archaeon]NIS11172.1 FAD synthase [Thermoplasmata archaeon]NIS19108.1 FAD synthase [Thermoplasmata archaeon]NIT76168.1 FAD synthase [Thermoplasmata archaeon]NIU48252.1 FAD synthase [Thermoplasmata archaeon]